jgi:predicted tellurium resistance membrane protein TerC
MIETFILLVLGFVAFFATGIDDTLAYAGLYLKNKRNHKKFISLGIILGTLISLGIAIFAGSLMEALPSRHLIGGIVLITLGVLTFTKRNNKEKHHQKTHSKLKKHLKVSKPQKFVSLKFVGLGMLLFFATGIDDIITYSNLIMAKGSWLAICIGVLIATFVSLIIAHFLSGKLKRFSHPERIGGTIIIIIGILLALKIL